MEVLEAQWIKWAEERKNRCKQIAQANKAKITLKQTQAPKVLWKDQI